MAFFDEIGKKISQTGQMAVQKTKDMADVAKMNSNISEEEKKINNTYFQIGQLYVSKHMNDAEDEFIVLIEQLNESQKKIEELKKQIQDIKGVKKCRICGAEIPENATFCSFCGAGVVQQKTVDAGNLIKCTNCGKMIEKGMKFCTFCGNPIVEKPNQLEKRCSKCGAVLEENVDFCTQCGTPVLKEKPLTGSQNRCPECGETIEDGMMFCTKCKTKIEALEAVPAPADNNIKESEISEETIAINDKPLCTNCGAEIEEGSKFCINCGSKVQTEQPTLEETPAKETEEGAPIRRACPNCGFEAESDGLFCVKCGTKID